jgi:potassium channel subfamily K
MLTSKSSRTARATVQGYSEANDEEEQEEIDEVESEKAREQAKLPFLYRNKTLISGVGVLVLFWVGVLVMRHFEGWSWETGIYVVTQIVTTVGYGDLTVTDDRSRLFMAFFVLVMIVFAASVVNDIATLLIDREHKAIRHALKKAEAQLGDGEPPQDYYEKARMHTLNSLLISIASFVATAAFSTIFYATYESCSCSYGVTAKSMAVNCTDAWTDPRYNCKDIVPGTDETYGATKNWIEAFYMSIITMTTVGFGDFSPKSKAGRWVGIVWMVFGALVTGNMVTSIAAFMNEAISNKKKKMRLTKDLFKQIDTDNTGFLSKANFMEYMLLKEGKVEMEDIVHINNMFKHLDKDGNGRVTVDEISHKLGEDKPEYEDEEYEDEE